MTFSELKQIRYRISEAIFRSSAWKLHYETKVERSVQDSNLRGETPSDF